jgi:exopolyphosphatase/guanosine-5'-triphosphate,3'-diphosphate pyrophosphatase
MSLKRLAAIDLGSLTVRLAVADSPGPGKFQVLLHRREITSLGRGLPQTGALNPADMDLTVAALGTFLEELQSLGAAACRAVATQAVRQAANREAFLKRLREELGLEVEVLSPEEEARLSFAGVLTALAPEYLEEPALAVVDVGGGSTEVALQRLGAEPFFASLPLGVLTLSQAHPLGDPPQAPRVAALKQELTRRLTGFYQQVIKPRLPAPPRLVGTAGAVTTLAAMALEMAVYDRERINNFLLTRAQVAALAARLAGLPEAARGRLPGLEPAKAGVMVAGALLVQALLTVFRQDALVAIDAGLLEGILASLAF